MFSIFCINNEQDKILKERRLSICLFYGNHSHCHSRYLDNMKACEYNNTCDCDKIKICKHKKIAFTVKLTKIPESGNECCKLRESCKPCKSCKLQKCCRMRECYKQYELR